MIVGVSGPEELVARTRQALVRLHAVIEGLEESTLARPTGSGWSIGTTLAHLAFYDDWVAERWRRWLATGQFQYLPDDIAELVNAAGERGWRAVQPDLAKADALQAAESVTTLIEQLPSHALEGAVSTGRPAMIDRSLHWSPHLDEIERALGSLRHPGSLA